MKIIIQPRTEYWHEAAVEEDDMYLAVPEALWNKLFPDTPAYEQDRFGYEHARCIEMREADFMRLLSDAKPWYDPTQLEMEKENEQ